MYQAFVKRTLDFVFALLGLVVLFPLFLALAAAIKLDSPGPVFFKQKRVKKGKGTFVMFKFRTMRTDTPQDVPTHLFVDSEAHITRLGKQMRRLSLDETIQIVHILAGTMSFIGPRPALWNQDDLIAERDKYGANGIRPGLTGWAQINGRDELPIGVKARLDGEYTKNISFRMDCRCFFGTIRSVLRREGVVEGGTGSAEREKRKAR